MSIQDLRAGARPTFEVRIMLQNQDPPQPREEQSGPVSGLDCLAVVIRHIFGLVPEALWPDLAINDPFMAYCWGDLSSPTADQQRALALRHLCSTLGVEEEQLTFERLAESVLMYQLLWSQDNFHLFKCRRKCAGEADWTRMFGPIFDRYTAQQSLVRFDGTGTLTEAVERNIGLGGSEEIRLVRDWYAPTILRVYYTPQANALGFEDLKKFEISDLPPRGDNEDQELLMDEYQLIASVQLRGPQDMCDSVRTFAGLGFPIQNVSGSRASLSQAWRTGQPSHRYMLYYIKGAVPNPDDGYVCKEVPTKSARRRRVDILTNALFNAPQDSLNNKRGRDEELDAPNEPKRAMKTDPRQSSDTRDIRNPATPAPRIDMQPSRQERTGEARRRSDRSYRSSRSYRSQDNYRRR